MDSNPLHHSNPPVGSLPLDKVASLPSSPGVYQFKNAQGRVIYIGKAKNLRNRVRSYFRNPQQLFGKTLVMVGKIADIEVIITSSEVEALILENNLIKELKPRYNVNLKDDKTYPYLVITNEPFPRILVTRQVKKDGSTWFGPYTEARQLRSILDFIGSIFPIRSCKLRLSPENISRGKFKVCLDYHIHKCKGPCEGLLTEEEYLLMIVEITRLLKGKTSATIRSLNERMLSFAKELKFEQAAELKTQIDSLKRYAERQKVVTSDTLDRDVFAVASRNDDGCGVVFKIREGKLLGSERLYMNNTEGVSVQDLLARVVERYYLETCNLLPDEIFLQTELPAEEKETLENLLISKISAEGKQKRTIRLTVPIIGEKAHLIQLCRENARHHLEEYLIQKQKRGEALREHSGLIALAELLHLPKTPNRIECFDNSHFHGTDYVSSMVAFVHGKAKKSDYRKFKLKTVQGSDDYAAMHEVLTRRYSGTLSVELPLPDLIVVDGGKGQLSTAVKVLVSLKLDIPVIGLAKRIEEIFTPHTSDPFNLPKTSPALKLIQQLRDEAHRFAVTYHRKLRTERTLETELTTIQGIGEKTAQKLLRHFGSVDLIRTAGVDELRAAAGNKTAALLYRFYHPLEEG
ncbi:excinuclease ABC subunit UvrC [Chlorobium phaeobacteroides]|jgi:excinuclease ABC subunit C|uniref:UvrABC system protein C n=1 Tax=Chlorobium phaeobacteroides (strain DSM 266 / SMG 266 / 2430) TaxID=290317 RepID=UVRC_CHLPD|nr:excinuclease ABC subunit UvrC [Chlorobium phaeobacteroides]A1BED8.1 RecName: Full=UvrABC system protein C; Short=Protein UvrC; AltName: Full=Excinuclease ABC subunit C [Chlorobium phaeobacteroides DSM 266]ABL64765.1 Excinuclease ABC subunit C [Chlorobium phaeobacteroides DSM 266]MBV5319399.1 excinuclease ABC subunit C [Chlorobium phaeobacteroides]